MARESFEDEAIAGLMNRHFINIKVDREERPDVDAVYMSAVQLMTGAGGWPMTVVMTPEGQPFFGGTYFPPEDRFGRPSFPRVLLGLAEAWRERRDELMRVAGDLTNHLEKSVVREAREELSRQVLDEALEVLAGSFDTRYGGFGGAPKFPPHAVLKFLLRQPRPEAWEMAELTLEKMAMGGIFDHLGGGFAHYSVDERWQVPHFEKMLYDNAQLAQRYLEAYQRSGNPVFRRVVEETLAFVQREMSDPGGGFYSSLDADSEGSEGSYYLWDDDEFGALLGEDAPLARAYYSVTPEGNFEGRNILVLRYLSGEVGERFGLSADELQVRLERIRGVLLEARERRVRPALDDKILTSWNGLMLAAFADAGRVLSRRDYLEVARRNADFLLGALLKNGRLLHRYRRGQAAVMGLLEDYAYLGLGLLALYRATFERRWLLSALELGTIMVERFVDSDGGGFFSSADDGERLIVRPKDFFDAAVPSGNGSAAELLTYLARFTGDRRLEELARAAVSPMMDAMRRHPNGFGTLLTTLEFLLTPPREVAVFGDRAAQDTQALLEVLRRETSPYTVMALVEAPEDPLVERLPFLQERGRLAGRATAYVCEAGTCRVPVDTPEGLAGQLSS